MNQFLMMALAMSGARLVTQSFYSSQTFTMPAGVSNLVSVVGQGGNGQPAHAGYYDPDTTNYYIDRYKQQYTWNGTSYEADGSPFLYTRSGPYPTNTTPLPSNYCDAITMPSYYCYAYVRSSETVPGAYNPPTSATTGPSTTGFGKTFPGGTGGAGSPVVYNDVAVTPGASYSLVIPTGGYITISYYQ